MNALRKSVLASLAAALFLVPSAAPATSFITGAVSGYPARWTAQGTTLADSVSVTDDANNVHTNLAFALGDAETITYTPDNPSDAGGKADVVISNAVFTTAYEYPGVEAVGGIDSQAAICVAQIDPDTTPSYYGWAGAYTVDGTTTNLTWLKLAGAAPPADATPVTVTMSFDYTVASPTVTFKAGTQTLNASGTTAIPLHDTTKTQVTAVSFSGEGSLAEMTAESAPGTIEVSWYMDDGTTLIDKSDVAAGGHPTHTNVVKNATAQYTYEFAGWAATAGAAAADVLDLSEATVFAATNYYAVFTATPVSYTLTWNLDGGSITSEAGNYTAAGSVAYDTSLTAPQVARTGYTFGGWSPSVAGTMPAADTTYTATWTINTYTITWKDGDGNTLDTDTVDYNVTPSYTGATPTKAATAQYTYSFDNTWSPTIVAATEDATYTAQFTATPVSYTLTWNLDGGSITSEAGAYTAAGSVANGTSLTAPQVARTGYTFGGWSPSVDTTMPAADTTYTATWTINTYTITWKDGDGNTLDTDTVDYNETPSYTGETPTKAPTAQYTYAFNNTWSPTIVPATADAIYTAQFTETLRSYTITWLDGDGETLKTETLAYGATPEYSGETPTKAATAEYTYTFNDTWLPAITSVTGPATYTAQFDEEEIVYPVLALAKPTLSSTVLASGTPGATVKATVAPAAVVTATNANVAFSVEGGVTNATFTALPWNDPVDWMLQASGAEDLPGRFYAKGEQNWFNKATNELDTVTDLADGMKGVDMASAPSAAGQMVRIQTCLEIPEGAMEELPTGNDVGSARTGFAVAQLSGDAAPAFYAFNGTTWDKLSGVAPAANTTNDLLIVLDVQASTARYYVDGIALYKENAGARTYAVPMGTSADNAIHGIGFANADGVKAPVVAEYDVPFEAAVGDTPYATAAAGLAAADKTGVETLYLLTNDVAGTIDLAVGDIVKVDTAKGSFAEGAGVGLASSVPAGYAIETSASGDVTTYTVGLVEYPIVWKLELAGATNAVANALTNSYTVADLPLALSPAGCEGYTFLGWTNNVAEGVQTAIPAGTTGAVTNWATWRRNAFTITWNVEGATTTSEVLPGVVPAFTGTPEKAADNTYTYTFAGWSDTQGGSAITLPEASANATYFAVFTPVYINYTITWNFKAADGTDTSDTTKVHWGDTPSHADPAGYVANNTIYAFDAWDTTPAAYDGTVTSYTATYTSTAAAAMVISVADAETGATTTNYVATLADAFGPNGAKDGDTVELLSNVTLTERVEPNVGANTAITIDLGGYTITREGTSGNGSVFDVKSGDVTITNGVIVCTQDDTAIAADGVYAITSRSGSNVTLADLTITVDSECGACAYPFSGSTMTIESGTYANVTTTPYRYNTAITGMAVNQPNEATQSLVIKGGSFSQYDPQLGDDSGKMTDFTDDGFVAIQDGNGNWVVQPGYNVTFDANGGSPAPAAQRVAAGGTATAPTAPTKDHYSFRAWQTNGVDWVFTDAVPSDMTLVADWTIDQFDVIWVADGAMVASNRVDYGTSTSSIQPADPTKENTSSAIYAFTGWSPEIAETVTQDATYTAQFSSIYLDPASLAINYNCYGTVAVSNAPAGATFFWTMYTNDVAFSSLSGPLPISSGKTTATLKFYAATTPVADGWAVVSITNGAEVITLRAPVVVKDVAAVVDGVEYAKADLDAAGAAALAGGKTLGLYVNGPTITLAEGQTLVSQVLSERNTPTPSVKAPAGTAEKVYTVNTAIDNATKTRTYTLTYDTPTVMYTSTDGQTVEYLDAKFKMSKDGTYKLLKDVERAQLTVGNVAAVLDLDGHEFSSTVTGSKGAIYVDSLIGNASLTIRDTAGGGSIVAENCYAIWGNRNATIAIEGGEIVGKTDVVYLSNAADTLTITGGTFRMASGSANFMLNMLDSARGTITVTGGSFQGFDPADNVAEGEGTSFLPAEGYVSVADDPSSGWFTVYEAVTVTFVNEKGDAPEAQVVGKSKTATKPADPAAVAGFRFDGWFAEGAEEAFDFTTPVAADLTLTAKWTPTTATVIWVVEGTQTEETYDIGATPVYPGATPTKAGTDSSVYVFTGWSPALGEVTAAGATYTAQFSLVSLSPASLELYPNCSNYVQVAGAPAGSTYTYKFAGQVGCDSYALNPPGWSKTEGWAWPYGKQPGGTGTITVTVTNDNAQIAVLTANVTVKDVAAVVDGVEYASADFANALAAAKSGDKVLEMYYYMYSYGKVALAEGESIRWKPADNRGKASFWTSAVTVPATTDTDWYKAIASKDAATGVTTVTCESQGAPYVKIDDGTTVSYSTSSFPTMSTAGATYTMLRDITRTSAIVTSASGVVLDLNGYTLTLTKGSMNVKGGLTVKDDSEAGTGKIAKTTAAGTDTKLFLVNGGGTVAITGGAYESAGEILYTDETAGSAATISGGTFSSTAADTAFLLNCSDSNKGAIAVTGGSFQGFDPANNAADGADTDYVSTGYVSVADDPSSGWYTVYEAVTVTFADDKVTPPEAQVIGKGKTASEPTAPAFTGWTFEGWYTNLVAGEAWDFDDPVVEDITLTAKWTQNEYDVIWVADGAQFASNRVAHGTAMPVPATNPTKDGDDDALYTFVKWMPAQDATVTSNATYTAEFKTWTKIAVPTAAANLVYTGAEQIGVAVGTGYTLSGDAVGTDAGDYTATASLADAENTVWADATEVNAAATAAKTIKWSIDKAPLSALAVALQGWIENETPNTPVVSGNAGGGAETITYWSGETQLAGQPATRGSYKVKVDVAETDNYLSGSATANFTINAPNEYTVIWIADNEEVGRESLEAGTIPTHAAPEKTDDTGKYAWTFAGWNDGTTQYGPADTLPGISGEVTYTATFTQSIATPLALPLADHAVDATVNGAAATVALAPTGTIAGVAYTAAPAPAWNEATASFAFEGLDWNAGTNWTVDAAQGADALAETAHNEGVFYAKASVELFSASPNDFKEFDDLGIAGVGYASEVASAAGEAVRVHTTIDVPEGGLESAPEVGTSKAGFAVLQLTGDAKPAFYAYNAGTDGPGTWTKLYGVEPKAGEADYLAVYDFAAAAPAVRYYIDGVPLYAAGDNDTKVYAIPLVGMSSLSTVAFGDAAMVKDDVVAVQDVSYVAAVGETPYTNIVEALAAVAAADKAEANGVTLSLLKTNLDPGETTVALAAGEAVTVDATGGSFAGDAPFVAAAAPAYKVVATGTAPVLTYKVELDLATVIWLAEDGTTEVWRTNAVIGTVPVYEGPDQAKDATDAALYTFSGWTNAAGVAYAPTDAFPAVAIGGTNYVATFKTWTKVARPTVATDLEYTGEEQTGVTVAAGSTATGVTVATNAGDYNATVSLAAEDSVWSDATDPAAAAARETITANWSIARKAVTVTADNKSKIAGNADPELTATVVGTLGTDTVAYDLERVTGETAGEYAITASGSAEQGNYSVTFVNGTFTISGAAAMVISVADAETGATTTNYVATLADAFGPNGAQDGDTVELLGDVTLDARIDVNLGANTELTIDLGGYTVTREGTSGNGSAFDVKSGNVLITNGAIDCSQDDTAIVADGVYAITARSGSTVTLTDLDVTVDSQAGACVYPFDGAHVTITSGNYANETDQPYQYHAGWQGMAVNQANVAQTLITITGGTFSQMNPMLGDDSAAEGTMSFVDPDFFAVSEGGAFTVVPRIDIALATVTVAEGLVYDGTGKAGVTSVDYGTTNLLLDTDYAVAYAANTNAGVETAFATITGVGLWTGTVTTNFSIAPMELTVTAASDAKTYDGTPLTKDDYTATALATGDAFASVTVSGTITDVGAVSNEVTAVSITNALGTVVTANYDITTVDGELKVTPAAITITVAGYNGVYDGAAHPAEVETVPADATILWSIDGGEWTADTPSIKDVGSKEVRAKASKANYADATSEIVTLAVTKAPLSVTAKAFEITYGDAPANDGVTYAGFVGGEDESVLGGTLAYAYTYEQFGDVGTAYTITPSGLTSDNYDISYTAGALTVVAKEVGLAWSPDPAKFTYTGEAQAPAATATGLVNGDEVAVTVEGGQTNAGTGYTATATALTGAKAGNYKLPAAATTTFDIDKAAITITVAAVDQTAVYTGEAITKNVKLADAYTLSSDDTTFYDASKVTRDDTTVSGTDVGEYPYGLAVSQFDYNDANVAAEFVLAADGKFTITAATAQIPTAIAGLTYDGTEQTGVAEGTGYTIAGNKAVNAGDYAATLTLAANYKWSDGTTDATKTVAWSIAKKSATITVGAASKKHGEADPTFDGEVTGLVADGDLGTVTYSRTNAGVEDVGVYEGVLDASFTANGNYDVTVTPGTFTIEENKITIIWVVDGNETPVEVEWGTAVADFKPADPSKTDDTGKYAYSFTGWTPEVVPVAADATYTATFATTIATPLALAVADEKLASTGVLPEMKMAQVTADVFGDLPDVELSASPDTARILRSANGQAMAQFGNLDWNQGVEWKMSATQTAEDDAKTAESAELPGKFYVKPEKAWFTAAASELVAVADTSDAAVGYTPAAASPEGEMVRVHTKVNVPAGGLPQAPETGDSKTGFAVLQLDGDTAPAFYAFGNGTWTKLAGVEPEQGEADFYAVYDLGAETPTARYYVNGVALYAAGEGGAKIYALPLASGTTSLKSISFASADMVAGDVEGEYDTSYVAAVDQTPYTEIDAALEAAGKAGEKTLALLKAGVPLDPAVSLGTGEKLVVDYAKGAFTNEVPVVSGVTGYDVKVTEADTVKTYELDPIVYPIEYVLGGGVNDASNTNEYTVADLPLALADASRTGYTFTGWTNNVSANAVATSIPVGTTGAVTNVATWTINSYALTINYLYTNGTVAATQFSSNVVYDTDYSVDSPVIAGYTADKLLVSGKMGAAPVTVDVTYTVNRHTVAFVDEDGTVLKAATEYDYGTPADAIAKPETPTKAATAEKVYTFAGWKPAVETVTSNAVYKASYSEADTKAAVITVAQDGTTNTIYVATIADAIAAAGDGDTIQLIGDVEGNATIEKDVTIDLNGNTWTGDVSVAGDVTIVDGSDDADGKLDGTVAVAEGGSVEVAGGIVDDGITGAGKVVVSGGTVNGGITGSGEIAVSGGTVNGGIEGDGDIAVSGGAVNGCVDAGGKLTITGGTITAAVGADEPAISAGGATEISGGTVNGDVEAVTGGDVKISGTADIKGNVEANGEGSTVGISGGTVSGTLSESNDGDLSVTGGHFEKDPSDYVAPGYYADGDDTNGYDVKERKSLEGAVITVADATYSGSAQAPAPVVKVDDETLELGKDFVAVYATNDLVNADTYDVTIVAIGAWIGSAETTFTIGKKQVVVKAKDLAVAFRTPVADVVYELEYDGIVDGEDPADVVATAPTASSDYAADSPAGSTFDIAVDVTGAAADNYSFVASETKGVLTVGAAEAPTILGTTTITVAGSTVTLQHVLQTGAKYYTYFTCTDLEKGEWVAAENSRAAESITPETVKDADGDDHEGTTVIFNGVSDDVRFYQVGYSSVPYASGDAMGEKPAGGEEP